MTARLNTKKRKKVLATGNNREVISVTTANVVKVKVDMIKYNFGLYSYL
jgi:hypothetical protein